MFVLTYFYYWTSDISRPAPASKELFLLFSA